MDPAKPIRFGILGTGMVAAFHRQAIHENAALECELAAVAHHDPGRFSAIADIFGVPCVDQATLLADPDVDAIVICTPSGQHAEQAVASARAGKHVLVEKPMALTLADADRMIRACRASDVQLGVVFQRRLDPFFQLVHDEIARGALGDLTMGLVSMPYFRGPTYYASAAWRGTWTQDGGGVLMNQGIHLIDLLVWYMGDPIEVTACADTTHRDIEVEDVAAATLRFAGGAVAGIVATTTTEPGFAHRIELYGTRGGLQIEGEHLVRWVRADGGEPPLTAHGEAETAGSGSDPQGIAPVGHVRAIADFVQSIRTGQRPAVDGAEGRRSLAAVLAVYGAAGLLRA